MKDAKTKEVHKEITAEIKKLKESHRIEHDVFYQALEEVLYSIVPLIVSD